MVINNLNLKGVSIVPTEAKTILVVDSDTVLPPAIAFQRFELVPREACQIAQCDRPVQLEQFADCDFFDGLKFLRKLLAEYLFRFDASETSDHIFILYR